MVRWSSLPLQPGTIHWTRLVVAQGNKMPWETTTTYNDNIYIIVADKEKKFIITRYIFQQQKVHLKRFTSTVKNSQ